MTRSTFGLAPVEHRASVPSVASAGGPCGGVVRGRPSSQAVATGSSLPAFSSPMTVEMDGAGNAAGHVGVRFDGSVLFSDGSIQCPSAREAPELVATAPATRFIEVRGHGRL